MRPAAPRNLVTRLLTLWRLMRLLGLPGSLLAAHASAYGQLASLELAREWALWRRRALLQLLGLLASVGAAGLAGVALMLWAVLPPAQMHAPWLLWLVPLVATTMSLLCFRAAQAVQGPPAFGGLRRQWAADRALLRGGRAQAAVAPAAAASEPPPR
jgi:hypothetical protein